MTTNEIIQDLLDKAGVEGKTTLGNLLEQAADRLEELDERVAIMLEGNNMLGAFLVDAEASNSILNSVNSHCISLDTVSRIIMLCGPACDALSPDGFIKWLKDKMMDDPRIMDEVFAMPDLKKTIWNNSVKEARPPEA